jgi:hypothetical protein
VIKLTLNLELEDFPYWSNYSDNSHPFFQELLQ